MSKPWQASDAAACPVGLRTMVVVLYFSVFFFAIVHFIEKSFIPVFLLRLKKPDYKRELVNSGCLRNDSNSPFYFQNLDCLVSPLLFIQYVKELRPLFTGVSDTRA